ncbi:MAG: GAF domain-containing protein [Candidatus Binatia bacterium]
MLRCSARASSTRPKRALLLLDAARRGSTSRSPASARPAPRPRRWRRSGSRPTGASPAGCWPTTSALVPDTRTDPRFYDAVDRRTTMQTRALLASPLRTRNGNIGVLEVVNPGAGHLDAGDLEFLDILASEIGVAYEKAALYRALEREVVDLRGFCRTAGVALAAVGVLLTAATFYRVRVLPWSELPSRPGVWAGAICVAIGVVLVGVGRG